MVLAAIDAGLPELGFSGHSRLEGEPDWTMSVEGTKEYRKTVLALKEKYKDKINIRLGIEQDYWSCSNHCHSHLHTLQRNRLDRNSRLLCYKPHSLRASQHLLQIIL